MLNVIFASVVGSDHLKTEKPLQDYALATLNKDKTLGYVFVADGHGSAKHFRSDIGSHLAVESAHTCVDEIVRGIVKKIREKDTRIIERNIKHLCTRITVLWREKVTEHFCNNPLSETERQICESENLELIDENGEKLNSYGLNYETKDAEIAKKQIKIPTLYGTTLLGAVYLTNPNFWFSFQIGDGKCLAIDIDGNIFSPIPEDTRLGFGVTTSLCGSDAINDFRHSSSNRGFENILGIVLMTDGVSDSFSREKLDNFIFSIYNSVKENSEQAQSELKNFLPELSKRGSGDDVSIAAIFDTTESIPREQTDLGKKLAEHISGSFIAVEKKFQDLFIS